MFDDKDFYLSKIDYNSVVGLIPARGGSKGVPKKNIKLLSDYPLIAYSIVAGKESSCINRVIVSTDSEEIAETARSFGAEVPFLRPQEYAADKSGDMEFVEHFIKYMADNEGIIPEYIVHLRPTTPLREVSVMDEAIRTCMNDRECCSLRSAHMASESPYKWFLKSDSGYFKPMKDGITNDEANLGRQKFPDVFVPDGYVDVLKTSYIINNYKLHGEKMLAFESPFCAEVDTLDDFEYLDFQISKKGSELLGYLKNNSK